MTKKSTLIFGDIAAFILITVIGFASHGETGLSYLQFNRHRLAFLSRSRHARFGSPGLISIHLPSSPRPR